MTPTLQAKLPEGIRGPANSWRVGGTKSIKVDVRFIAATKNQNINTLVAEGRFRKICTYRS